MWGGDGCSGWSAYARGARGRGREGRDALTDAGGGVAYDAGVFYLVRFHRSGRAAGGGGARPSERGEMLAGSRPRAAKPKEEEAWGSRSEAGTNRGGSSRRRRRCGAGSSRGGGHPRESSTPPFLPPSLGDANAKQVGSI